MTDPKVIELQEAWSEMDRAAQNIATALPAQMSERAAALDEARLRMRTAVYAVGLTTSTVEKMTAALTDCIPFLAIYMDKYAREYERSELHPTHAEILDRVSRLTGGDPLSHKLKVEA